MNIILDYDGTIHDCGKIYIPAFRKGYRRLTEMGLAPERSFTDSYITGFLGYTVPKMWEMFMPELAQEHKDACGDFIAGEMEKMVLSGQSELYEGAVEALTELKKGGHRLIFLSNCLRSYMDMHCKAHELDRFYDDFFCTEDFDFKPKPEIFAEIRGRYEGEFIVIGDRHLDLEIADMYSLRSVGCLYGYGEEGELEGATVKVGSVRELPEAIERLTTA